MSKAHLLPHVEDLLRSMPARATLKTEQGLEWRGRLAAVIEAWSLPQTVSLRTNFASLDSPHIGTSEQGYNGLIQLLHQARHSLQLSLPATPGVVVAHKATFEFFDAVRKIVELAKLELFFSDPYLDADFIASYMPHVASGVKVRLLGKQKIPALVSAAQAFAKESGLAIEVRSSPTLHDRHVIVDGTACYMSGASFKDGPKNAPSAITEVKDNFAPTKAALEALWGAGKAESQS